MTTTTEPISEEDIVEVIEEEDLGTFTASTVSELLNPDVSASAVASYMEDIEERVDECVAVGECPKVYSLKWYQDLKPLEGLEFDGRKAVDDLVQSIEDQKLLADEEVSDILEEYFTEYEAVATIKKRSEVEYSFRDLPFVNYDSIDETYRLVEE